MQICNQTIRIRTRVDLHYYIPLCQPASTTSCQLQPQLIELRRTNGQDCPGHLRPYATTHPSPICGIPSGPSPNPGGSGPIISEGGEPNDCIYPKDINKIIQMTNGTRTSPMSSTTFFPVSGSFSLYPGSSNTAKILRTLSNWDS